jgi:hypothetical protein
LEKDLDRVDTIVDHGYCIAGFEMKHETTRAIRLKILIRKLRDTTSANPAIAEKVGLLKSTFSIRAGGIHILHNLRIATETFPNQ